MTNPADKIISVFLDKEVLNLKDLDVSHSLIAQGIQLYIEEVRRYAQALSPALFQLSFNTDHSMTISVDPNIDICGPFLAGRCHNNDRSCEKLHLCREFGRCTIRNCHYPHDFTRGQNRRIIEENNCGGIDAQLIVRLIRMKKNLIHSASFSVPRRTPMYRQEPATQDDVNRQVDISYPSVKRAPQIDMELIEMILATDGIQIEKKFNQCENEYFRRETIQLKRTTDVEKLLSSPIHPPENVQLKFKRTKQLIDRTSFKLKTSLNSLQEKITDSRIRLYTSLLIRDTNPFIITDLSTMKEQIFLVQCENEFDVEKVRQQYESKRQLLNKDIELIQIYEYDAVIIQYIDGNKLMRYEDIQRIIPTFTETIFTFEIKDANCAEVEFVSGQACKQWISIAGRAESRSNLQVTPVINDVDDSEPMPNLTQSTPLRLSSSFTPKPPGTTIKLHSDWLIAVTHPLFKQEFQNYIHDQLGGEIVINGDELTYTGDFPRLPRSPTNESILSNKTNNYMQTLKFSTLRDLKPYHINLLRANSANIAFSRIQRNDYLIVGKSQDIFLLKNKLFPKTNQRPQQEQARSSMSLLPNDSRSFACGGKIDHPYRSPSMSSLYQETVEQPASTMSLPPAFIFPVTTSEQMSFFSIKPFEDRLQRHLTETFNVKIIIERSTVNEKNKREKPHILVKVSGQTKDVQSAQEDLRNLFSLLRSRKFDDKTDGNWTTIEEATEVIQHHLLSNDLICVCQKVSPTTVQINYFDLTHPQFGVDEQQIEDLIHDHFSSATITYTQQSTLTKFVKEWTDLEEKIRQHTDYKKNLCLHDQTNGVYLFGITKLVKEFRQAFEEVKSQYVPQACKIDLSEKQLNYLAHVVKNDFNKLEKQHKPGGCELSLIRLRQHGDFLAAPQMHAKIKESLEALAKIEESTFDIKSTGFEVLISKEPERLLALVKSKCYLEKKIQTDRTHIIVPTTLVPELEDLTPQHEAAGTANSTSITIGQSTITITIGDLTQQAVDMIVVCSTSEILQKGILATAGTGVQTEHAVKASTGQQTYATSNGSLPCKKIFFLPWKADKSDPNSLKTSLSTFVDTAIKYAVKNEYQTIAFPSVGCGKLGFDPSIIAQYMIDEARLQLQTTTSKLDVSFVLVPAQQNVYNEFVKYLNTIQTPSSVTSKIPSTRRKTNTSNIAYNEKTVHITLISGNKSHLIKCKNDILDLAQSASFTKKLTEKHDMIDWSQETIHQYYTYCLKQHVVPTMNLEERTLDLVGSKDAVHEAEKYFYELTTKTFKQACINAASRGVIWSVEVTPNSNAWEQYSDKLNGTIEDAYLKKLDRIDLINDKQERCRIDLKLMVEQHEADTRHIRRKVVDASLPEEWETTDDNCVRVNLLPSSKEYQDILKRFNSTMLNHYTQILKIERIQNVRWYKQYHAHREEFQRRYQQLDERLLFHGCANPSTNQIIQECFNRSFAGVNGTVYGHGVYFHNNASYSHQYAKPYERSGERTMFLAHVLIGKTCVGNSQMKVPPPGHDTTSDGQNIFVTYHDAGAYANYLITYK